MDHRQAALGTCGRGVVELGRQSLEAKKLQHELPPPAGLVPVPPGCSQGWLLRPALFRCLSLQPLFSGGLHCRLRFYTLPSLVRQLRKLSQRQVGRGLVWCVLGNELGLYIPQVPS